MAMDFGNLAKAWRFPGVIIWSLRQIAITLAPPNLDRK